MRNYEIIKAVYDRCPDFKERQYTLDQCFDRCLDIREMIEEERPELKSESESDQKLKDYLDKQEFFNDTKGN